MRLNEGGFDRILRVIAGVVLLYLGWAGVVVGFWGIVLKWLGFLPLVTGLLGWCPLYAALGWSTRRPARMA